ncbi:MAG: chorismate mutase [Proteobacteria bacterium]|jgi:chorismate mutase|nr:chorismate mutase [Pseudomonadota bacterium]MDA0926537.1 chorismate mutase [Pseudomonadota bacterium]
MSEQAIPAELQEIRKQIDEIDDRLLRLLAERFQLTHAVGVIKANQNLNSFDSSREAEKITRLRELCSSLDIDPNLVEELFTRIMQEVVKNHDRLRQARN